jgi:hypothetical protein
MMNIRFRRAHQLAALALAASTAIAGALPAAAADAPSAAPVDPLALQVDEPAAYAAAPTRISLEAAVGHATRRDAQGGQRDRGIARLALDARHAQGLGEAGGGALRGVVSARIDASDPEDPRIAGAVFSLREAFVGWQDAGAATVVEFGRIRLRDGPGYGFNPTDFFRDHALRTIGTQNPVALREHRMGAVMLRGQRLWAGGSAALALAPELQQSGRSDDAFSLDLGATNDRARALATLGTRWGERLSSTLLLYAEDGAAPQPGASFTALLGAATTVHAEASLARQRSLIARALAQPEPEQQRTRATLGLTHTTADKLSLTVEAHYNGHALDAAGWRQRLSPAAGVPAQAALAYHAQALALQDSASRWAAMLWLTRPDLLAPRLDLSLMARHNFSDRSWTAWAELRWRMDGRDLALQLLRNAGRAHSEGGSAPLATAVSLVYAHYF